MSALRLYFNNTHWVEYDLSIHYEEHTRYYQRWYNPHNADISDAFEYIHPDFNVAVGFDVNADHVWDTCERWTDAEWGHRHPFAGIYASRTLVDLNGDFVRSDPDRSFVSIADEEAKYGRDPDVGSLKDGKTWHLGPYRFADQLLSVSQHYVREQKTKWARFAIIVSDGNASSPYERFELRREKPQELLLPYNGSAFERLLELYRECYRSRLHDYHPWITPDARNPTNKSNWTITAGACSPGDAIAGLFGNWERFVRSTGTPKNWLDERFDYSSVNKEIKTRFVSEKTIVRDLPRLPTEGELKDAGAPPELFADLECRKKEEQKKRDADSALREALRNPNPDNIKQLEKWLEAQIEIQEAA